MAATLERDLRCQEELVEQARLCVTRKVTPLAEVLRLLALRISVIGYSA